MLKLYASRREFDSFASWVLSGGLSGDLLGLSWGVWCACSAVFRPPWAFRADRSAIWSRVGPSWGP
eukprot:7674032-Pyramimonas_sp.AAC.1